MASYRLLPTAQADLTGIIQFYEDSAGNEIARRMTLKFYEAFRFLADTPGAGHKREDLLPGRDVLFWPVGDFMIVYRPSTPVRIAAVIRRNRDIARVIKWRPL